MKFCLINPNWNFEGSIYFGCREPHLPLEYGYAKQLLEIAGHEAVIIDAHLEGIAVTEIASRTAAYNPDIAIITTAPSYLFWRCAQPELRVPFNITREIKQNRNRQGGMPAVIAVGPHASATPQAVLKKMGTDAVIRGEFEEILTLLESPFPTDWEGVPSLCTGGPADTGKRPHLCDVSKLAALRWPDEVIQRHFHHHHRFDHPQHGAGAEIEGSRGCPYHCSFCAKEYFRGPYRKRPLKTILEEMDGLMAQGAEYFYFIDEIFLPDRELLREVSDRGIKFGIQTRIELWDHEALDLLGNSGCVSIEAGVESITEQGRRHLNKRSSISLEGITDLLVFANRTVSFVQANLLDSKNDNPGEVEHWRRNLLERGVWANEPVPLFPYPGSLEYRRRWGEPDDNAWERAQTLYLSENSALSDIQENRPLSLEELETELTDAK